jgi:hypothetical protein
MFDSLKTQNAPTRLDEVIDSALTHMIDLDPTTDAYAKAADQVSKLYKLKESTTPKRVSSDTLAVVLGNLAGIGMILGYERAHIVTSKALGFVLRPSK